MARQAKGISARAWFYGLAVSAERREYLLIDSNSGQQHGTYASLEQAQGAARYDRLSQFEIWRGDVKVS